MNEGPENLVLVYLRRLDERMACIGADVAELKGRMTSLEQQMAHLSASQASHYAILSTRLDRQEQRLERIERRLDLAEASP